MIISFAVEIPSQDAFSSLRKLPTSPRISRASLLAAVEVDGGGGGSGGGGDVVVVATVAAVFLVVDKDDDATMRAPSDFADFSDAGRRLYG